MYICGKQYIPGGSEPVIESMAEQAEDAWLNRLADEAEADGLEGSVSLEEMAAALRELHG
ncbi:hypothetical protein LG634_27065 [Streptomyces bambusae]|nr:hypothetical protein [Streptomyces bambusae]MCB5168471.1 hypothetical protein [Streptomyces bambusae]